jgi:hypothetical protein
MACVYTYIHTYVSTIKSMNEHLRHTPHASSLQVSVIPGFTRRHPPRPEQARKSDRALDGTTADFDPSRRPPEPHFAFPHAPLPPLDPSAARRHPDQTSRLSQVGPSASCIASPRFLAHRSAPACLLLPPTRAVRLESPSHTTPLPTLLRPILLSPRLPPDDAAVDFLVRDPPPPPCSVCARIASHPRPRHHARPSSCDKPPAHSTPALSRQRTPSIDS